MEADYTEIERMWRNIYADIMTPNDFMKVCEKYIYETMTNVLMTHRLITKAKHLIGEVRAVVATTNGRVRLDIKGWNGSPFLSELDEEKDVKQVADLIHSYEKHIGIADFRSETDKKGNTTLVRKVGELSVKPLMGTEKTPRMEDGVLYVSQENFYKGMDNYLRVVANLYGLPRGVRGTKGGLYSNEYQENFPSLNKN